VTATKSSRVGESVPLRSRPGWCCGMPQPPSSATLLADGQLSLAGGGGYKHDVAGEVVWPLGDNLNTVRDLAVYDSDTETTSVVNHRVYDTYGNLKSASNPAAADCVFGFTGRYSDPVTGLQNNSTRWYDPGTGAWISRDRIWADTNPYRYCGNSPTNAVDPTGTKVPGGGAAVGEPTSGTVVQGPGVYYPPLGSYCYLSDNSPTGHWEWRWHGRIPVYYVSLAYTLWAQMGRPRLASVLQGVSSWGDITNNIKDAEDASVPGMVLGGHGSWKGGGVGTKCRDRDINADSLTPADIDIIKRKLAPDAPVIVQGCLQATPKREEQMQKLADKLNRPVIGNTGLTKGLYGEGDWKVYYPKGWKGKVFR
jgi:RHS repeat-associated protein